MSKKIMYDGSCDGVCYECACQECYGECAMTCRITSHPEENAIMSGVEENGHVIDCTEYIPCPPEEDDDDV